MNDEWSGIIPAYTVSPSSINILLLVVLTVTAGVCKPSLGDCANLVSVIPSHAPPFTETRKGRSEGWNNLPAVSQMVKYGNWGLSLALLNSKFLISVCPASGSGLWIMIYSFLLSLHLFDHCSWQRILFGQDLRWLWQQAEREERPLLPEKQWRR